MPPDTYSDRLLNCHQIKIKRSVSEKGLREHEAKNKGEAEKPKIKLTVEVWRRTAWPQLCPSMDLQYVDLTMGKESL